VGESQRTIQLRERLERLLHEAVEYVPDHAHSPIQLGRDLPVELFLTQQTALVVREAHDSMGDLGTAAVGTAVGPQFGENADRPLAITCIPSSIPLPDYHTIGPHRASRQFC